MDIAQLEAQLKAAKEQQRKEGDEYWRSLKERIKPMVTWSVKWLDKYTVNIGLQYTQEAMQLIAEADKLYPNSYERVYDEARRHRGMTYLLIHNVLVRSGGGWMVITMPRRNFQDWLELTDDQAQMFRDGRVPDELKAM